MCGALLSARSCFALVYLQSALTISRYPNKVFRHQDVLGCVPSFLWWVGLVIAQSMVSVVVLSMTYWGPKGF